MSRKLKVAIIGSGNIGTDLMIKVMRNSQHLEMGAMVGVDPESDGLARASRLGVPVTAEGIEGLLRLPVFKEIDIAFDATSAAAHKKHDELLRKHGVQVIDLTPAAIGPYVIPSINLEEVDAANINMVTCGGQATIPIVAAVSRVAKVHYGEIVASIASKSAGPGTRANIDEFTETTRLAIEKLGGAERGKAVIVLNPRRATADHARHRVRAVRRSRQGSRGEEHRGHGEGGARLRARLPPEAESAVRGHPRERAAQRAEGRASPWPQDLGVPGSRGCGALPAGLCRQSGHHDFCGHGLW
jgi:acetaldehyde dehydrogenase (acetylating)